MMVLILALLMALPSPGLVMASGGANPGTETNPTKIVGPIISATVVLDPHWLDNPPAGYDPNLIGRGSIRFKKGTLTSGGVFQLNSQLPFNWGCELILPQDSNGYPAGSELTMVRFGNIPLSSWVPSDLVIKLFAGLGITLTNPAEYPIPMVTDVENAVCTPASLADTPFPKPGSLSFDAVIQFKVPQK
jgi:hypothetical protein